LKPVPKRSRRALSNPGPASPCHENTKNLKTPKKKSKKTLLFSKKELCHNDDVWRHLFFFCFEKTEVKSLICTEHSKSTRHNSVHYTRKEEKEKERKKMNQQPQVVTGMISTHGGYHPVAGGFSSHGHPHVGFTSSVHGYATPVPAPMYYTPAPAIGAPVIGEFSTHGGYHPVISGQSVHGHVHTGFAADRALPPVAYVAPAPVVYASSYVPAPAPAANVVYGAVVSASGLPVGQFSTHGGFHPAVIGASTHGNLHYGYSQSIHGQAAPFQ
jgi:hypothetical protein